MLEKYEKNYKKIFYQILIINLILFSIISYRVIYIIFLFQMLPTFYLISSKSYLIKSKLEKEKYKEISNKYTSYGFIYIFLVVFFFITAAQLKLKFGWYGLWKF